MKAIELYTDILGRPRIISTPGPHYTSKCTLEGDMVSILHHP